jgi:hypothetical protein
VLRVVVPALGRLGWEDVAELRAHPGMVTLRRVLWEIERAQCPLPSGTLRGCPSMSSFSGSRMVNRVPVAVT